MTGDTTASLGPPMDCEQVTRDEVIQGYLLDTLSEDTREAFERHYFDCDQCLGELQALEAIRDELRQTPEPQRHMRPRFNVWLPVAAVAAVFVLAVTAMFWRSAPPALPPPKVAVQPGVTTPPLPPPTAASPDTSKPSLEQLARVEPAPYEPLTFRAVPDEATARFQQGMNRYGQADFRGAITDLKAAADLEPDAPHIRFFLGVSQLLAGETRSAIDSLHAAVAIGDSPYLEEAHLYLAKAYLRRGDPGAAEQELKRVASLNGPRREEANRLLNRVERSRRP